MLIVCLFISCNLEDKRKVLKLLSVELSQIINSIVAYKIGIMIAQAN